MKSPRCTILAGILLASLSSLAAGVAQAQSAPAARTQTAAASPVAAGARSQTAAAQISTAENEKAYRKDAARHIYEKNGFLPVSKEDLPPEFRVVRAANGFYRLPLSNDEVAAMGG